MPKNKFFQAIGKGEKNTPPEPMIPNNLMTRAEGAPSKPHADTTVKKQKVNP
jgi:hypothetical protein